MIQHIVYLYILICFVYIFVSTRMFLFYFSGCPLAETICFVKIWTTLLFIFYIKIFIAFLILYTLYMISSLSLWSMYKTFFAVCLLGSFLLLTIVGMPGNWISKTANSPTR